METKEFQKSRKYTHPCQFAPNLSGPRCEIPVILRHRTQRVSRIWSKKLILLGSPNPTLKCYVTRKIEYVAMGMGCDLPEVRGPPTPDAMGVTGPTSEIRRGNRRNNSGFCEENLFNLILMRLIQKAVVYRTLQLPYQSIDQSYKKIVREFFALRTQKSEVMA